MTVFLLPSGYWAVRLKYWSWSESREGSRFGSLCWPEGGPRAGRRSWCGSETGAWPGSRFGAVRRARGWRSRL